LVLDFNDISHDVPGRSTKNIDPTAGGVVGINLTSASYKYQWSQAHTASSVARDDTYKKVGAWRRIFQADLSRADRLPRTISQFWPGVDVDPVKK
jgi:hypothetical protein